MNHKVLPNNDVIDAVIKMLETCPSVILPVKGYSMLPFIIGDVESVELVRPGLVKEGDVVLAWINGNRYVVHRVIRIDGARLQLMGDGNLTANEYCTVNDIKARADYVINKHGKKRYLYTKWRVRASRLWWVLRPLRRLILAFYRRTILQFEIRK
jgi:hypothetical protein